jgi:hypothetical protein
VRFHTKVELAIHMLERIVQAAVPIEWVGADSVYGGNLDLRTWLEAQQYAYVLALPCNEPVAFQTPEGRRREEVAWVESFVLHQQDWQRLSMSEGTKGPRLFDWAVVPMLQRWEDDARHFLLIGRSMADPKEKRYYFVFAPAGTRLPEMVRASGARWHMEEEFETGKDMGLDHYEVRSFIGWYRHIRLVLLAQALLAGIYAQARPSCPVTALWGPILLPLTVVFRAPSAGSAHLARFFVRTPGAGLLVVASGASELGQVLPYQTSNVRQLGVVLQLTGFPDFQDFSCNSQTSRKSPGSLLASVPQVLFP